MSRSWRVADPRSRGPAETLHFLDTHGAHASDRSRPRDDTNQYKAKAYGRRGDQALHLAPKLLPCW